MSNMASQTTGISFVCPIICSGPYKRKHQSSASLDFVRGIHRWLVDSPHKGPVKCFHKMMWSWVVMWCTLVSSSWTEVELFVHVILIIIYVCQWHYHNQRLLRSLSSVNAEPRNWLNFYIKSSPPSDTYMRQWMGSVLVQIMACSLFGAKPLFKPMLGYFQLDS